MMSQRVSFFRNCLITLLLRKIPLEPDMGTVFTTSFLHDV